MLTGRRLARISIYDPLDTDGAGEAVEGLLRRAGPPPDTEGATALAALVEVRLHEA